MYKKIDPESWNRKEHFEFFSKYDEPFFGIVTEVDCTKAYQTAKENDLSFFSLYLYNSLKAANQIEEFRTRIKGDSVVLYDRIHASPTIGRDDGTFAFSYVNYHDDFFVFADSLKKETEAVKNSTGLRFPTGKVRDDVIHYSSLPWSPFTGLTHARDFKISDGIPKITFGKAFQRESKLIMAVSVNAHHGLADGLHVSMFLTLFQELLDQNIGHISI